MYGHYMANFFDVEAGQSKGEVIRREFPEGGAPCSTNGVKFCIGYHVKKHVEPGPHQRRKPGQFIKNPKSVIYQAVEPGTSSIAPNVQIRQWEIRQKSRYFE